MTIHERLPVAIVNNSPTPYRTHLHLRIAAEMPLVRLWSVFTHQYSNAPWANELPASIGPVCFGMAEKSDLQARPLHQFSEWRKGGRIIDWMKANRIAAVVLGGYNDLGRLRILRWCRKSGIPCFLFGDGNILADVESGLKSWLKRQLLPVILREAAGALHCGRHGYSYFTRYGVPASRLFSFPYEPDYGQIQQTPAAVVARIRNRFNLTAQRRYLLFCGRLTPVKRPDLLIQAFVRVAANRPAWDLVFIGDGPLRESLISQISPELETRVHFTGFLNDSADIAALYRCSDVFVLPSDYEPWGVVVSEAATCLALVCSDKIGAAGDLLQNGVNGHSFTSGDVNSLASAILEVTADDVIDRMKAASPVVLNQWRRQADPVLGLRAALASVGLIG